MNRILIIEDDTNIAEEVKRHLESWGLEALIAPDFKEIKKTFSDFDPHLVLIDIKLPFFDGYYWCREIRNISNVPIIFISSASDNMNMIMAMNMGADDFIAKPFDLDVLSAKIQALLRRTYDFSVSSHFISFGDLNLNTSDQTLHYHDQVIELSKNEYRILLTLLEHTGETVSREKLMERLWKSDCFVDENTLTVNVNRLRKKLSTYEINDLIRTKVGLGYIIG